MKLVALFVVAASVAASNAFAQLKYRIGTFAGDGSPITWPTLPGGAWEWHTLTGGVVPLPVLNSATDIVVHVADATPVVSLDPDWNGAPSPDVYGSSPDESDADLNGNLVLAAPEGSVAPLRIRVWIANKDLNPLSGLIDIPENLWTAGIHDWTGKMVYTLDGAPWTDLRDRVRLNANLSHNYICPPADLNFPDNSETIHCGSIIRFNTVGLQDYPEDVDAGQIIGFLRGRENYVPVGQAPSAVQNAVGYVGARHMIAGGPDVNGSADPGAVVAGDAPIDQPAMEVLFDNSIDHVANENHRGAALGTATKLANIGTVRVGPNAQPISTTASVERAFGIQAQIAARRGTVRAILSTGNLRGSYEAGNGVWVVRQATAANDTVGPGTVTSTLAYNDDVGKRGMRASVVANLFTPGYLAAKSPGKGAIKLIEVVGPVNGSITADNVYWNAPFEPSFDAPFAPNPFVHVHHRGILVWDGGITGSINIKYNLEQADIICAGMKGSCAIGLSARGSIVAYGDPTGFPHGSFGDMLSLSIGYTPDFSADPGQAEEYPERVLPPAYAGYSRGLRGSAVPPIAMIDTYGEAQWKHPHSSTAPGSLMVYDGGSVDCVVRFTSTGEGFAGGGSNAVNIYNMHQYNPKPSSGENPSWRVNPYRSRVEVPLNRDEIGEHRWFSLQFGRWPLRASAPLFRLPEECTAESFGVPIGGGIESGVVWSGRVGAPVADWFVLAGKFKARALGPDADVWLDLTAPTEPSEEPLGSAGLCMVEGDMNGRLQVHGLPANRSVRIGERLGGVTDTSFLDTLHAHAVTMPTLTAEPSPRGTRAGFTWPVGTGEVQVLNDSFDEKPHWWPGLDGQVVVDRWNPTDVPRPATHCKGKVLIMDTTTTYGGYYLEPASPSGALYELPNYNMLSGPAVPMAVDPVVGADPVNGGAVGLAPYTIHAADCLPPNPSSWSLTNVPAPSLLPPVQLSALFDGHLGYRLRFYGPVFGVGEGGLQGLRVERSPSGTFGSDTIDETARFQVVVPAAPSELMLRDIHLRLACGTKYPVGYYRVVRAQDSQSPGEDFLFSDLTFSTLTTRENYVAPFAYYLNLCECSKADIGMVGGVPGADCILDNNDFVVFIDYFFAQNGIADVGSVGGVPGPDGAWDNNDFIVFIDYFFAGCEPAGAELSFACDPGFAGRTVGGGAPEPGRVTDADAAARAVARAAGVQVSARGALAAMMAVMPADRRGPFAAALASDAPITPDTLVAALDAMFEAAQAARGQTPGQPAVPR